MLAVASPQDKSTGCRYAGPDNAEAKGRKKDGKESFLAVIARWSDYACKRQMTQPSKFWAYAGICDAADHDLIKLQYGRIDHSHQRARSHNLEP